MHEEPQIITMPAQLQAYIDEMRRRIAADKQRYEEHHKWLYPWHPDLWAVVAGALIARARYYRGEILRAKHNVARYMRGEEPTKQMPHVQFWVDSVDVELEELRTALEDALSWDGQRKAQYANAEVAKSMEEMSNSLLQASSSQLKKTKDLIERYTYGG